MTRARPFLKWAGGKTQLLEALSRRIPRELADGGISTFVEPFLGGGAVFFHFNSRFSFEKCQLFDVNDELVLAYRVVKRDTGDLIECLATLEKDYLARDEEGRKALFYAVRDEFNRARPRINFKRYSRAWVPRACQLVFLNRTCYNGLFRVNSRGGFNVPFGRYRRPKVLDADLLRADAELLENATIHCGDFANSSRYIGKDSFVYFDPPYRPLSPTAAFTQYSAGGFGDREQRRLASFFAKCDAKGARLMLSNSDPSDGFFDELYAAYHIDRVPARRAINSDATRRGEISEIIVTNY
jgi:DNA adenine methylase